MAAQYFKAKLAPSKTPHKLTPANAYTLVVKGLFVRHSILVVAAAVQLAVCWFFSSRWAVVPPAALLLAYALSTLFHWNHALGAACSAGIEVARRFMAMNADIMDRREELGLVSVNEWRGAGIGNASSFQVSYYFRDVESLHRFAHEDMHRKAWDWYNEVRPEDVGIFHETFVVPAGAYETIYDNCIPVGLGRGSVKCPDAKNDEGKWMSTLVSADTPALKTQSARLGRGPDMRPKA
ncbi:hypothetical protein HIM_05519 [Hirsutella minnesotensis 3608]|uniref:Uncharacterized protein n=1 Tax=Hirsutella minnesotensis 3608 TaxID=1043627 RepID=A0A0F7ZUK7_9HYPO|nr:hypothetical protein HIM_05519 [Hirsutella minnesotensis 3608]